MAYGERFLKSGSGHSDDDRRLMALVESLIHEVSVERPTILFRNAFREALQVKKIAHR